MTRSKIEESLKMSVDIPRDEFKRNVKPLLRQIMVITDFSRLSENTYAYAVRVAKRFEATIHLVHFGSKLAPEYSGITDASHLKRLRYSLSKEANRAEFANLDIRTHVLDRRNVSHSLGSLQDEHGCDLIVVHTRAPQVIQSHFDQQLAEKIVAISTIPVLLFGPAALAGGIDEPKSVLVPFDFSDKAEATFPVLRLLATQYQFSIKLLFVQTFRSHWLQRLTQTNEYEIMTFEKQFDELIEAELPSHDVELEFCQGIPEYEFGNRACNADADLIVIGTYERLGSLTKCIIRQAQCPVLAVPTEWVGRH